MDTKRNKSGTGRWKKGISGNPAGRPRGSRNQSALVFQELLDGEGAALIRKGIELSMAGDTRALGICWDRLLPARRDRAITLQLPKTLDVQGVSVALASVVSAVAEGRITPGEAESLARLLEARMRVVEFEALAQRVDKLENARTPIETGATAGPTLAWIAENYSLEIRDSRNIVQPSVEPANGSEADGPTVPPSDLRSTR